MKALLVIDSDKTALDFTAYLTSEGCECVRYRQPVKAMDNLEEIDPQLLVLSVVDFPRHWKPLVQFAHNSLTSQFAVCLIVAETLTEDEEKKAEHLDITGVFSQSFTVEEKADFRKILTNCVLHQSEDNHDIAKESEEEKLEETAEIIPVPKKKAPQQFMFVHPKSGVIITGKILSRTEDGIIFEPDWPDETVDLKKSDIILRCSLYIENNCINPTAVVLYVGSELELAII